MSHIFQICPIAFASHGDNVPYDIFSFKITDGPNKSFINLLAANKSDRFYQFWTKTLVITDKHHHERTWMQLIAYAEYIQCLVGITWLIFSQILTTDTP